MSPVFNLLALFVAVNVLSTVSTSPVGSAAAPANAFTEDKPLDCPKLKGECAMEKDKQIKYFKTFVNILRSHPEVANYEEVCSEAKMTDKEAALICDDTDDILFQAKVYLRCIASHGGPSPQVFLIAIENHIKCKMP